MRFNKKWRVNNVVPLVYWIGQVMRFCLPVSDAKVVSEVDFEVTKMPC